MECDKSRKRMESDHLRVANPIRPEDLDRRVTQQGIYPSIPASHGVPWSTYVKSQKVSSRSRSISSSTEALDSDQARLTMRRILQHTRSLPTSSPEPQIQIIGRESKSDSGHSNRYITRTPMVIGSNRSSYRSDCMTEYDDYAALCSRTSPTSSIGMIVRPKIRSVSSYGALTSKSKREGDKAVPKCSSPIIGESASMFTDMTDTMLKVLDRRMAINAQAPELENTLAEEAYACGQKGQNMTSYLSNPVTSVSLPTQLLYRNTMPRTNVGIPIAVSTPVPQVGPTLHRPTPTPRVCDILEPVASEQARVRYLEERMRHIKGIHWTPSEGRSVEENSLAREIQEYCSREHERHHYEKETHDAMLNSMIDNKIKQRQLEKRERDEIYKQMTCNLEKVRAIARESLSRASTILVEERQMALTETDFLNIKDEMNKIDRNLKGLYLNWQAEHKEAITSEQCDAIQKFYEPHVRKYETKYKILYQTLKQAIDRSQIPSSRVSASELIPSLVALEDASTLKRKECERDKPAIEKPHMFSTREGRLTPKSACI